MQYSSWTWQEGQEQEGQEWEGQEQEELAFINTEQQSSYLL